MKKRTITGIFMLAIFIPVLIMREMFVFYQIMMIGLSCIASYELIHMYEKKKKFPGISKFIIMLCSLLVYFSAVTEWQRIWMNADPTIASNILKTFNINIGFLPMIILCTVVLFSLLVVYREFDGADIGKALTILIYAGVGFAALTVLRSIGLRFILYMFLITILTDVFAYVVGSLIGKNKMCPHISPHKTWEGSIGGTLIATIVGTCFALFYGKMFGSLFGPVEAKTLLHAAPFIDSAFLERLNAVEIIFMLFSFTLFTSIISQLGDLVASKLKRTYEIKDYGNLFPGHGGVLDRFDSALFAAMFLLTIFSILAIITPELAVTFNWL
ncbi:MAG: phosphatidate cytidylyltransferase [Acholeplasmatales bacterium]|nr:phosphatidate cytidylyltransferase [Acholeplasmatales bacterium]